MSGETTEQFGAKLGSVVEQGFLCLAMGMGDRLRLFDALIDAEAAKGSAVTSQEIADKAGLRERYVREWLGAVVCGGLVEVDPEGKLYSVPPHRRALLRHGSNKSSLGFGSYLGFFGRASEEVEKCFALDGPAGIAYEGYPGFYEFMGGLSTKRSEDHLVQDFLPSVPGLVDQLQQGIQVLDLGCGAGVPSRLIAAEYPKTHAYGIDITPEAIALATAVEPKLPNLSYAIMDGGALDKAWAAKFTYVTAFDAIHDQGRPDLALAEVFRVLKPGGTFSMLDVAGFSNPYEDRAKAGTPLGPPMPTLCYACSLVHCMPVSLNQEGGLGLGAMWGRATAERMLKAAGFVDVQLLPVPYDPINVHYVAKKPSA